MYLDDKDKDTELYHDLIRIMLKWGNEDATDLETLVALWNFLELED